MELILNTFGTSLNRDNEGFVITYKDGQQRLPVAGITSIQLSKGAQITSDAVLLAIENEIEVIFTDRSGNPVGRIWSPKYGSISTIRKGQLNFSFSHDAVDWIKEVIRRKIENQQALILMMKPETGVESWQVDKAVNRLEDYRTKIAGLDGEIVSDVAATLRGWEGVSSKIYFEMLNCYIPEHLRFEQRSQQYGLEQVLDAKTCDVSRACFISMDPDVYYNPDAQPVDWNQYLAFDNPQELFSQKHRLESEMKETMKRQEQEERAARNADPDAAEILKIKELLKLRATPKERAEAYVPEQLNEVIGDVKRNIEETGVQVTEILNINYGKKIRMKLGHRLAEVNLFYGKRGFSVVKSPRSGTNAELNDLCADIISGYVMQL